MRLSLEAAKNIDEGSCGEILPECRNHLVVGTSRQLQTDTERGNGDVEGFARIAESCLRSRELEQMFGGLGWCQKCTLAQQQTTKQT